MAQCSFLLWLSPSGEVQKGTRLHRECSVRTLTAGEQHNSPVQSRVSVVPSCAVADPETREADSADTECTPALDSEQMREHD
jgi:hypothetical protein